jgi:hypothetical protein
MFFVKKREKRKTGFLITNYSFNLMQKINIVASVIFYFIGAFSAAAALLNWDWFFESSNASIFIKWFGRKGARWLYFIVGIMIIIVASIILGGEISKFEMKQ